MQNFKKALVATSSVAALVAVAACSSGGKGGGTPALSPALKANGNPANLACNGTNTDPASTNTDVSTLVTTVKQQVTGSPTALGGTRVASYDVASGATSGAFTVTSAGNATGTITTKDSVRVAFESTHDPDGSGNYVPTFQFHDLTPAVGSTSSALTLRIIPQGLYNAFLSLAGFSGPPFPTGVAGATQFAAAIVDCDGDAMQNVVVDTLPLCKAGTGFPCTVYFQGSAPNPNATHTDASGQIVVVGVPAGSPTSITIKAIPAAGGTLTTVGKVTVNGAADSVALATFEPHDYTP